MFLSKVQQSYCYIQLCNYREVIVFKPISNQFKYSCGLQFKFRKVLKCFLPLNGWLIFSRLNAFKEFATSFSSLTLHAINLLLWKKILSHTLFKIITVSRPSTLLRVFLMRKSGCHTNGGNWRGAGSFCKPKSLKFPSSVGYHPHEKIESLCLSSDHRLHIAKKGTSNSF